MHKIKAITPNSIAQELGLEPGDRLLTINNQKITDVLDYRFIIQDEFLTIEIEKADTEIWELEIEKDETEDLGIIFESDLMDKPRSCENRCIFCFMDQLPKGMRPSLYFKDDDPRLSFLSGNYVTLTNLSEREAERIARYHLSPLHISVHAAEPTLRRRMLGNDDAGDLFRHLKRFSQAGITMNFQIVLCKGINDGAALDDTIAALMDLGECAASLSVVPVGLSKHREGLMPLQVFSQEDALKIIAQVEKWHPFAYCADEWYLKARIPLPSYEHYNDFPQLENGVGMCALFEREFQSVAVSKRLPGIVTGEAAYGLITKLVPNAKVYSVRNDFFGWEITVSGLLTGRDVVGQIGSRAKADGCAGVFLPANMFRAGTALTLDDMTRAEIEQGLGLPVWVGSADGRDFTEQVEKCLR